ncbi:hypothetical protein TNCV_4029251 [Trichonephila clavipes]|nr:hypothetical protein TNCV_4029251 [Trichonephila clavipes]
MRITTNTLITISPPDLKSGWHASYMELHPIRMDFVETKHQEMLREIKEVAVAQWPWYQIMAGMPRDRAQYR